MLVCILIVPAFSLSAQVVICRAEGIRISFSEANLIGRSTFILFSPNIQIKERDRKNIAIQKVPQGQVLVTVKSWNELNYEIMVQLKIPDIPTRAFKTTLTVNTSWKPAEAYELDCTSYQVVY